MGYLDRLNAGQKHIVLMHVPAIFLEVITGSKGSYQVFQLAASDRWLLLEYRVCQYIQCGLYHLQYLLNWSKI